MNQPYYGDAQLLITMNDGPIIEDCYKELQDVIKDWLEQKYGKGSVKCVEIIGEEGEYGDVENSDEDN